MLQALTALPPPAAAAADGRVRGAAGVDDPGAGAGVHRPRRAARRAGDGARSGGLAVVCAVTGMGGVGKTTTAIEYAHRHARSSTWRGGCPPRIRRWCPARLAELARALDLVDAARSAAVAVARLLGELAGRERWLVVFDNAEDPRALAPLLPHGPGRVLITSRNPGWRGVASPVGVREFHRAESVALLRTIAPGLSERTRIGSRRRSGTCRWRVEQAGSMVRDAGLDVEVYLRLLRERAGELLATTAAGRIRCRWPRRGRWRSTGSPPTTRPRWICSPVAWCGPEPVPLNLLTDHPDVLPDRLPQPCSDPLALARCTRMLHRRAMATVTPHSIAGAPGAGGAAARPHPRRAPDRGGWAAVVVRLLHAALPGDVWNNPVVWPRWQQLLPHVLAAVDPDRPPRRRPRRAVLAARPGRRLPADPRRARAALPLFQRAYATAGPGSATTTPTPSPRPTTSPSTCARWASTSRPATWTRTPSPAAGGCSATTTPTPSPRPTTSPSTCRAGPAPAGPRPRRGHPHPPPPGARRRPPRHPHLGQQPRRRPARAG